MPEAPQAMTISVIGDNDVEVKKDVQCMWMMHGAVRKKGFSEIEFTLSYIEGTKEISDGRSLRKEVKRPRGIR